jgi:hypothetical protein
MWPELEIYLTEYRRKLDEVSAELVEIERGEITGICETVSMDPSAVEKWDAFRSLVRSQVRFELKHKRARELIGEACGRPEVLQ